MHRWTRSWLTTVIAWIAVLFIGGAAIAGVGSQSEKQDKGKNVEAQASESPEAPEASEVEESSEGEKADNHGQCVSTWAHKAKEGVDDVSLEGRYKGGFLSAVAQGEDSGAECDQSELWAEWVAKQEAATTTASTHGKSGERGKSAEHKGQGHAEDEQEESSGS